ncbi:putative N,O-diacetyl muramidase [Ceraceosorus guamensis]|uniref:Lysozyme n=1 Tax=Ceraceosorus guamensis TaxID=1522189 RepID=A0A316VR30_9BASI|nr:putative N,O-diacetyl muramidase [Ceraceosorus guamensis]PWN40119.1 putative N,O-diacetyl muramidase [Ceraceosorus guamensis]
MVRIASSIIALAAAATLAVASPVEKRAPAGVPGFDISHYQGTVNMASQKSKGARFVIIKATEGTTYTDTSFSANYNGATSAGLIRGAYHFAHPNSGSGATQANYFIAHGGGWSNDGRTLPGMLDIEYNPGSGGTCYGLSAASMVSWIRDFVNTYHSKTGRYPLIYTTNDWWNTCTGNSKAFSANSPLVLARYGASSPGTIPGGWPYQTIWQWADSGTFPGDQDVFNGSEASLKKLATG